jgi:hypothetical protein
MAKKKVKAAIPPETLLTANNVAEDIAQTQNGATTSVLESAIPTIDFDITEEPAAEKSARSTKKKATKSRAVKPLAEETTPVANELVEEKEQAPELTLVEEPVAATHIQTAETATNLQTIEPDVEEAPPATKNLVKEKGQASEKAVKMKRLTLDIPKPLHKAIKAQAVEEGSSIVDMLRTLLEQHYGK